MATRTEKFQTPNSIESEKVAFESYVTDQIKAATSDILSLSNKVKTIDGNTTEVPVSNTTFIISSGLLKIAKPKQPTTADDSWSPQGIRVSIIATGNASFNFNNGTTGTALVDGQYYEFIYIGTTASTSTQASFDADSWKEINSWYARWK